jgi:hypothetical protein
MITASEINTATPARLADEGEVFVGPDAHTRVCVQITPFGRVEIYVYRDGHFLNSFFVAAPHG